MSVEDDIQTALTASRPVALSTLRSHSIAARGRSLLQRKEEAEVILRKGLELLKSSQSDPWSRGANDLFSNKHRTLAQKLQIAIPVYIASVSKGSPPAQAARIWGMSREDQEMAHVAHFFARDALIRAAYGPPERVKRRFDNADSEITQILEASIPLPAGVNDGVLSKETTERLGQVLCELEKLERDEERKLAQLRERESTFREAFRCFAQGYELDPFNAELIYQLAEAYRVGWGCEVDEPRSVELFQRAANMGHAASQKSMGDAHAQCGFECLPKNEALAAKWYESAAGLGDEEAVCMIVEYYQHGIGVEKDHATAARILRGAAARGDECAQHNLTAFAIDLGSPYAED